MSEIDKLSVGLTLDTSQFHANISGAQQKVGQVAGDIKGQLGGMAGAFQEPTKAAGGLHSALSNIVTVGAGVALAGIATNLVGGLKDAMGSLGDLADATRKLSRETGTTAEQASGLLAVFERYGLGSDKASVSLGIFSKHLMGIEDLSEEAIVGGKGFAATMNQVGVAFQDAKGNALPMNDVLLAVADKFQKMPDGIEKTGLAMTMFGKSGKDMLPILNLGKEAMTEAMDTAKKYGLVLSGENVEAMKKLSMVNKDMDEAMKGLSVQAGLVLMPVMSQLAKWGASLAQGLNQTLLPAIKEVAHWVGDFAGKIGNVVKAIMSGDWTALGPMLQALFNDVFGNLWKKLGDISGSIFNWLKGQLGGISWLDAWGDVAGKIGNVFREIFRGDFAALGPMMQALFQDIFTKLGAALGSAGTVQTWLTAQWARIDWLQVWGDFQRLAKAFDAWLGDIEISIAKWLVEMWQKIDWTDIFNQIGHWTEQFSAWIAATDWAKLGTDTGKFIVTMFKDGIKALETALSGKGAGGIDWGGVASAFGEGLTTVFKITGQITVAIIQFAAALAWELAKALGPALAGAINEGVKQATGGIDIGGAAGNLGKAMGLGGGSGPELTPSGSSWGTGFAVGGAFTVGGVGGVDSQRVSFRATPGERVTVVPPGGTAGRGGIVINGPLVRATVTGEGDENRLARKIWSLLTSDRDVVLGGGVV